MTIYLEDIYKSQIVWHLSGKTGEFWLYFAQKNISLLSFILEVTTFN